MNATLRRALRGRERPQAARVPAAAVVGSVLAVFAWQTAAVAAEPGDETATRTTRPDDPDAATRTTRPDDPDAGSRLRSLGVVTVTGGRPSSLPTQIPTTTEGVVSDQIRTSINATDSEDALKYLPSLLVRKRFIGDYNHAILSTRASGTGNSARSLVYADGILLSNLLGNGIANGTNYAPRWSMVDPEEIDRVDVMYGPFSAAYPGNSAGAVVDYVTRMPRRLEEHAKLGLAVQPNELYGQQKTYRGTQASASLGSGEGPWSWWINLGRTRSRSQPLTFTTLPVASGIAIDDGSAPATTTVTGAVPGRSTTNVPWYIVGNGTAYDTVQDLAKLKVAYDLTATLRATYVFGWWQNDAQGRPTTFLHDASGVPVYSGNVAIHGRRYSLAPTAFGLTDDSQMHQMHGLTLATRSNGTWDWQLAASRYDYRRDQQRSPSISLPAADAGGNGFLQDQDGTGWTTVAARGTWRPQGAGGAHVVDFGAGRDAFDLSIRRDTVVDDWRSAPPVALASRVAGEVDVDNLWVQDSWRLAPRWHAVLGLRYERWQATDGTSATANVEHRYPARTEHTASPKAAIGWQWTENTTVKASIGRAVRFPTVGELYGATTGGPLTFINDPDLRPERSWTSELTAERDLADVRIRATLFYETTDDALYNQLIAGTTTSRVQNVDRVRTRGIELAYAGRPATLRTVELGASLTYAHSVIVANDGFPASVGKWQPRVPRWRSTVYATWSPSDRWAWTAAARYSGRQYSTLDNSDVNADAYFGASQYLTIDLRARWAVDRHWSVAFGIDNANNDKYWNFHPYPQRTFVAELRFDR
jgi:iron complex outermembrane receptor protein